jgi:hypothetical protein
MKQPVNRKLRTEMFEGSGWLRRPDYFVDAVRECALESAPACDSVACSAFFKRLSHTRQRASKGGCTQGG